MPHTYFVVGSYYEAHQPDFLGVAEAFDDYALLINYQRGKMRKPSGFPIIYNNLLTCAFADPECQVAWVLGDDVHPRQDCFAGAQAILLSDPTIGVIFPIECWLNEQKDAVTQLPFTDKIVSYYEALGGVPAEIEQLFAGFACAAIHRRAWEAVGPMDESFGRGYCEDLDWGVRCWRAGYRVVNYRRGWYLHERGQTYNKLVQEGLYDPQEPYHAADRIRQKWPFLWVDSNEEVMARVRAWYKEARSR